MIKKLAVAGCVITMCLAVFSSKAMTAENTAEFGARLGLVNCSGCDGSFQIGADYYIPLTDKDEADIRLTFSSEKHFDIWSLSGNYIYNLQREEGAPGNWYAGAGPALTRISMDIFGDSSSSTKFGLNIMGGYKFDNRMSAEIIYTWADSHDFYGINVGYRF
jgi:opacity protein-like surface antigen